MRQYLTSKTILILFLLIINNNSYSQDKVFDVVILKSGINVVGAIIELIPGKTVKMYDTRGKEIIIDFSDIERIEKKNFNYDKYMEVPLITEEDKLRKNFAFYINGGFFIRQDEIETSHNLNLTANYNFKQFGIGPGIFLTRINEKTVSAVVMDLRYTFLIKGIKPYFFADVGYAFGETDAKGVIAKFGSGMRYNINENIGLTADVSYLFQNYNYNVSNLKYSSKVYNVAGTYRGVLLNGGIAVSIF